MKGKQYIIILWGLLFTFGSILAQEEESAEISLEAYSDAFQDRFFHALQEKAIENYEKAIDLLLTCKKLEPENAVVDYELARNHMTLKQYTEAVGYLKKAIATDPENIWYSDALFKTYVLQNDINNAIALGKQLAQKKYQYKENLIFLYVKIEKYKDALQLLDELDATLGPSTRRKQLRSRYASLLKGGNTMPVKKAEQQNPLAKIEDQIHRYQNAADYGTLLTYMDDVLETYPSQSKFYYIKGKTLNQVKKYNQAVGFLKTALDFLVDDHTLENNIYKELVLAYKAVGNSEKVQEYTKKLKKKT